MVLGIGSRGLSPVMQATARFDTIARSVYLGLSPSEHSSGEKIARGSITKAGSSRARRVLVEEAWTYRLPARVSRKIGYRHDGLPKAVLDIAWKAQMRLCQRYQRMQARGKNHNIIATAIAREMVGFIWAIARSVSPATVAM